MNIPVSIPIYENEKKIYFLVLGLKYAILKESIMVLLILR